MSFVERIFGENNKRGRTPSEHFVDATSRFEEFLLAQGESLESADRQAVLFAVFMAREMPEISVLEAVQQLRELVPIFMGGKIEAPAYQGKRKDVPPLEFFRVHYASVAKEGRLGPGQLSILDRRLYGALTDEIKLRDPNASVAEFIARQREGAVSWQDRIAIRNDACAKLLGVSNDDAIRFFSRIQPQRKGRSKGSVDL